MAWIGEGRKEGMNIRIREGVKSDGKVVQKRGLEKGFQGDEEMFKYIEQKDLRK